MKTLFIIIAIISLQTAITFAGNDNDNKTSINNTQTTQINGKIVDFNNQEGLSGVAIKIVGTDQVVYTDFDGNFSIKNLHLGENVKLQVNYISYKSVVISDFKTSAINNTVKVSLSRVD